MRTWLNRCPSIWGYIASVSKKKDVTSGIVTDPDTDRLALVTDKGNLFGEEYTQAAAFDFLLDKNTRHPALPTCLPPAWPKM
ncbi:MAG: hypothetical protein U5J63_06870 [Fodinibius sp.]|nr:hypothetical protein [Fodinibius sp.]